MVVIKKMCEKNVNIKYSDILGNCKCCNMEDNCSKTYKECRLYNKDFWNTIDKQLNKIRHEFFNYIIKKKEEE